MSPISTKYLELCNNALTLYDEEINNNKVKIDLRPLNAEHKKIINSYKKELAKESFSMESNNVIKLDYELIKALNNEEVIELDLSTLNGKQRFLISNCMKDLEKLQNPKVFKAKVREHNRKKNNECAAKFRRKRKQFEIKNEVTSDHIRDLIKDVAKRNPQILVNLKANLIENKLKYAFMRIKQSFQEQQTRAKIK